MQTAKKLGFKKGDFVYTGAFPAIIISDAHTSTPCCEVWGFEQEMGSVYASDLRAISAGEFLRMCEENGHNPVTPYSEVSKKAINDNIVGKLENMTLLMY